MSCVTILYSTDKQYLINNYRGNKTNVFDMFDHNSFENKDLDDFSMP
jgi:hypothetical protein